MSHLSRFFHFHDGEPSHRAVKMLGSLVGAIMLATTATAVTVIQAMDQNTDVGDLHLIGNCPTIEAPIGAPRIDITESQADVTWYTTSNADNNEIEYAISGNTPTRVPATNGREHRASIINIIPGATITFRITSRATSSDTVAQSGSCAFNVPGDDNSAPEILHATVQDIGTTTAIIAFTTTEPSHGWVRVGTAAASPETWKSTSSEAADDPLSTTHIVTLTDLVPGQTYTGSAFAQDEAGNSTNIDLSPFITLSEIIEDTTSPIITDLDCRITPDGLLVTFSVPELEVSGQIEYGPINEWTDKMTSDQKVEAAPTQNLQRGITTFVRTLPYVKTSEPYMIAATAHDAAGNTTRFPAIFCITTGP